MEPTPLDRLRTLSDKLLEPEIYAQVVEELPDALVVIKESGEIVIFNKKASYMFGYHPTEVIGQNLRILVPDDKQGKHDGHVEGFFKDLRARPMGVGLDLAGRHKSGRLFPVEINLSPIVAPSATYGMAVIRSKA